MNILTVPLKYLHHLPDCGKGCSIADSLANLSWGRTAGKWRDCTCGLANLVQAMSLDGEGIKMPEEGQKGFQFNPRWKASENYGDFRKAAGIESGDALTFHQWMQFADACFRAGLAAKKD